MKINDKELSIIFMNLKSLNDRNSFDEFYKKYNKIVYGIAFSILKNKEDSEDVVQNIFSKILTLDKEKLPSTKYASWLYEVTKNESISIYRKRNETIDIDKIYEIEEQDNEINKVIDKIQYNKLISKLNNKEKEIISLKILSNLSFEEISKLLGEPIGTIKWRYYKSINTLKIMLSNLSMFIVTFIIGLKTLIKKEMKEQKNQEQVIDENNKEDNNNTFMQDIDRIKEQATKKIENTIDEKINNSVNQNEIDIKEETTVPSEIEVNTINYVGVGVLSISGVFLLLTIIFSIILVKHQLKVKKKTSK